MRETGRGLSLLVVPFRAAVMIVGAIAFIALLITGYLTPQRLIANWWVLVILLIVGGVIMGVWREDEA